MFDCGVTSFSFPTAPFELVIKAAAKSDLMNIEWESSIHAPYKDTARLRRIAAFQKRYGIKCCAYGTDFRLCETPIEELPGYIRAAKLLGTKVLRLWAGNKSLRKWSEQRKQALFAECKLAAKMAAKAGVVLCLECHKNTYVGTPENALKLIQAVDSPTFQLCWRPNPERGVMDNLASLHMLREYIVLVRVFHKKGLDWRPLEEGKEEWSAYLTELHSNRHLLLEHMPDNELGTLLQEASALREIISQESYVQKDALL